MSLFLTNFAKNIPELVTPFVKTLIKSEVLNFIVNHRLKKQGINLFSTLSIKLMITYKANHYLNLI